MNGKYFEVALIAAPGYYDQFPVVRSRMGPRAEGIQFIGSLRAGAVVVVGEFQSTFSAVVCAQARGDTTLTTFARTCGFEAVTMERRLYASSPRRCQHNDWRETTGVDVMLIQVSQSGSSPRRRRLTQVDGFLDTADQFAQLCSVSDLPMLNRVDPYGTVILTSVEMEQFIAEIDSVRESVNMPSELSILADVSRLALICLDHSSMEPHLEGD